MYKPLIILSVIIFTAFCGLSWLGYHAVEKWSEGLEGKRLGEFARAAELIRQDVKSKLDDLIRTEEQRRYTDYQYYYVPENTAAGQQQMPLLRSPLGDRLEYGLAYGHFQVEPDGRIVTPYHTRESQSEQQRQPAQQDELARKAGLHVYNIERNVLPALSSTSGAFRLPSKESLVEYADKIRSKRSIKADLDTQKVGKKQPAEAQRNRMQEYLIESLQKDTQEAQIITGQRSIVTSNVAQSIVPSREQRRLQSSEQAVQDDRAIQLNESVQVEGTESGDDGRTLQEALSADQTELAPIQEVLTQEAPQPPSRPQPAAGQDQADTVQIRIEPFVPLVVPGGDAEQPIFGGQVFLLRRVQIEDKHFLQGFQLNEESLVEEVEESAERFIGAGMAFELAQGLTGQKTSDNANKEVAYTAILDFAGLGNLVLNLIETDPDRIIKQMDELRDWYFSIIAIVFLAVTLGLASLWHNLRAQIRLVEKKDDFISAVSHELRTPLTSLRMYSEMLEKNWVKSKDKLTEYYRNMRQESERLSRLVENILDFSRIQKGRKRYTFSLGDIDECVAEAVDMMKPYAAENGFSTEMELGQVGQAAFDRDVVTQIVVNLLDNAIKYARSAKDKTITVRTKRQNEFIVIEVEDHGPGIPRRQHKKVFEQFYRLGSEATRETTGTGLGLALVKKFAEAHSGFVEILSAQPTGTIFRVALATQV